MDTKFGKYISPHLVKINERISINNKEISDYDLSEILEKIAEKVEIYNSEHETKVKEFEVVTSLALIYRNRTWWKRRLYKHSRPEWYQL